MLLRIKHFSRIFSQQRMAYYENHSKMVTLPAKGDSKGTVIFLHGLGDSGSGWASGMNYLQHQGLRDIKFLLPTA